MGWEGDEVLTVLALTTPLEAHVREANRLAEVQRLDVLDTPPEEAFDRIVRLVKDLLHAPVATITMFDAHRGWIKASQGWCAQSETDRRKTFCTHTIQGDGPLVIPDATKDDRFSVNPYVIGPPYIKSYAGVPLKTDRGLNIGALCVVDFKPREFTPDQIRIMTSFAEIAVQELELRQQLATDVLTGLLSRRSFETEAARAIGLARRHAQPLSLVTFDLDYFKSINDRFGHAIGDRVLIRVAQVAKAFLRETDLIARIGGEEFAILLPRTDRKDAAAVANKLRIAIEQLKFELDGTSFGVTASFGVSPLLKDEIELSKLMERADSSLYQAKNAGRNRCVTWIQDDNPAVARRRVLKAGNIVFNRRMSTMDCTVRSLSETGATMDVLNASEVPPKFDLVIRADNFERACRILSHTDRHIEVEFA
jgi:diguanylate cyclase (GGDEF)-like protein